MRWVFLSRPARGEWRGIENWMLRLGRGLRRSGDTVSVIAPRRSLWETACEREKFHFDACSPAADWNPVIAGRLAGLLRGLRPDVVICADFRSARIARFAAQRPAIGVKLPTDRALTNGWLDRFSFRHAVDRLFEDHRAARQLLLRHPWVPAGRILLVPNGVECEPGGPDPARRAAARAALAAGDGDFVVGAAARFVAEKRLMLALEVFARAVNGSGYRLYLIGDGPQRRELERRIRALGLADRVTLTGWRNDAAELLRGCDVVLHTGLSDAMPNSVLEGMAAGAVVLAVRSGSTAELITAGRDGFLFEADDVEGMAATLRELRADPERRARIGAAAARRVAESFSMDAAVRRVRAGMAAVAEARRLLQEAGYRSAGSRRGLAHSDLSLDPALGAASTCGVVRGAADATAWIATPAGRACVRWTAPGQGSAAFRAFRMAHRLELLGIQTAPHLAVGWGAKERGGGARAFLIIGETPGAESVRVWAERHAGLPEAMNMLAAAGGAWLGSLHAVRVLPRDLSPANLLVRLGPAIRPEFVLCDVAQCRIARRISFADIRDNFQQALHTFGDLLTERQRLRFAVAYRRVRGLGRGTLRRLVRALADASASRRS